MSTGAMELQELGHSLDATARSAREFVTVCLSDGSGSLTRAYVLPEDLRDWERRFVPGGTAVKVFTELPVDDRPACLVRAAIWTAVNGNDCYYSTACLPGAWVDQP